MGSSSRLKSVLKEQKDERTFIEWALPLLVSQISVDFKVTEMVTDILYQNTKKPLNLNIVVKLFVKNPHLVPPLTRLDSARSLIYRILSTNEGFALFKNNSNYLEMEFKDFVVFPSSSCRFLLDQYRQLRYEFGGRIGHSNHSAARHDSRPNRRST